MIGHHLDTPQLHALNNPAQSKLVKWQLAETLILLLRTANCLNRCRTVGGVLTVISGSWPSQKFTNQLFFLSLHPCWKPTQYLTHKPLNTIMDLAFSFHYTFFFHFISNQIKDQSWKAFCFFPYHDIPGILHSSDSYATLQVLVKKVGFLCLYDQILDRVYKIPWK